MIVKNIFYKNFFLKDKKYYQNIKKTKKIYKLLKKEIENLDIPQLHSYDQNYELGFSLQTIKKFSKFENIILIGMGGSILGAKSIYSFLKDKIKKKVFFFDNLDENLYSQLNKLRGINNSCFIIISKSGNTLETITNLSVISSKISLKNKLIFITEITNNNLLNIATNCNAEIIEHKNFIGGRYSVLSEVGMLPAALMGLKINKFRNIKKFIKNKNFSSSLIKSVASIYTLNTKGLNNSIILNYNSSLNDLGFWYQQLVGESLGKKNKGINPILSIAPKDHHSMLQLYLDGPKDKFFTFFNFLNKKNFKYKVSSKILKKSMNYIKNKSVQSIVNAQYSATKKIFSLKQIPFRQFIIKRKGEEELGAMFTFFVLETILLARLMKINPYDQPAVEQVKVETKKILSN